MKFNIGKSYKKAVKIFKLLISLTVTLYEDLHLFLCVSSTEKNEAHVYVQYMFFISPTVFK
jgi:hypothetical protein